MTPRFFLLLFFVVPSALAAAPTQRYIVLTRHPFETGVRIRRFNAIDGFAADLDFEQIQRLRVSPEVRLIEPVVERHALDDAVVLGQQTTPWGIEAVHAPEVWPVTRGRAVDGSGPVHVAVIDTGIDYRSTELRAAYKGGTNLVDGSGDPLDDNGHGTHVAGIIAAADDGEGVVGVAPEVDLYAVKVLDACGIGTSENVIAAVDWLIQEKRTVGGNWVANFSLGSDTPSVAEQEAFRRGTGAGILFVAAAGNGYNAVNPTANLAYPAGYPTVVSVGAIDSAGRVAKFSQRGPDLKVVAPGVGVLSTLIGAEVQTSDGHRYAGTTPVVVQNILGFRLDGFCLPPPDISGAYVFCGYGGAASDFPASVSGKIALIQRGPDGTTVKFAEKLLNAQRAGAIGVILFDDFAEALPTPALGNYTTPSAVPNFPPTIFISLANGTALENAAGLTVSLRFGQETWAPLDGTSMAAPHAAAVAALAWAVAPPASAADIAHAVEFTARSLGDANSYGHGVVDALAAAESLDPSAFGISSGNPRTAPQGRPGKN